MDPLGVLQAVVAVALYPGGAFLLVVALVLAWAARVAPRFQLTIQDAAGALAATVATSLAPIPGSVLSGLPPSPAFGAAPNLLAVVLLEGVAVSLVARDTWRQRELVAALAALLPLFCLAAAAATLSLPLLVAAPGGLLTAGRVLAAAATLTAAALLLRAATPGQLIALASITILSVVMALGMFLVSMPAPAAAAATLALAAVCGVLLRAVRRFATSPTALAAAAALQGAAAVAAILVARV